MNPKKILYVDDEAMALKYFERLVGPLAPVLTASSVDEGRSVLDANGADIAVLVCDQRMPGARGNELLRHARDHHPTVVRMLTTAYSDIGEAIEAINSGEIYRYISKPWTLEHLRADLRNALDLAELRAERDSLLRQKLMVEQGRLLGQRLGQLCLMGASLGGDGYEAALHTYVRAALAAGVASPAVDWRHWDHVDLQRAEADRAVRLVRSVRSWWDRWNTAAPSADQRLSLLAQALGGAVVDGACRLVDCTPFTEVLGGAPGSLVNDGDAAGLAWLLWVGGAARLSVDGAVCSVRTADALAPPADWLSTAIEAAEPQGV
ncbi:MAG: response regulator [Hydrogenophaga sp.]|uniref:response regulator n=1 Tax=Hydrogenophaga sp. TaxID=1904254 RepID=UPI001DA864B0|nr:response regulator [Hydrogenophaga sp.]MBX3609342.1 response regulator [Hydrogenophaga sp.]